MKVRFEEVTVKGKRVWIEDGKRRQETKVFMQTLNPWNRDGDGTPKSRSQIEQEIMLECKEWMQEKKP